VDIPVTPAKTGGVVDQAGSVRPDDANELEVTPAIKHSDEPESISQSGVDRHCRRPIDRVW
jgi:hypothetical protein